MEHQARGAAAPRAPGPAPASDSRAAHGARTWPPPLSQRCALAARTAARCPAPARAACPRGEARDRTPGRGLRAQVGAASAFWTPQAGAASDASSALLAASLAGLSLAAPLPATPAAERRGHASARGAATPVTPFSDDGGGGGNDAPRSAQHGLSTPQSASSQAASPLDVNQASPGGALLSPAVAADAAAFGAKVSRLREGLALAALHLHCPSCDTLCAEPDFAQCLALSCAVCDASFCGWCLGCATHVQTHHHVASCGGGSHTTRAAFRAAHRPRRAQRAAAFVEEHTRLAWPRAFASAAPSQVDTVLRFSLLQAAKDDLEAHGIALYDTEGAVSYRTFEPQADALDMMPRRFPGFPGLGRAVNADAEERNDDDVAAPRGCAAAFAEEEQRAQRNAAWQRVAGPRTPLGAVNDADVNVMRGMLQRMPLGAAGAPRLLGPWRDGNGADGDAAAPAPVTPEAGGARAAYAAAAARRKEPQPRRSPLSSMR